MDTQLAIDIGNSRIKLGLFVEPQSPDPLPRCVERIALPVADHDLFQQVRDWLLERDAPRDSWVGSVNPPLLSQLLDHWPSERDKPRLADRPATRLLANHTRFPERVGTDRLFNAVAANRLRRRGQPAIIIDSGTATKVDFVDAEGGFRGGAILAGFELIAKALHEGTAQLPRINTRDLAEPPDPVGHDTESALRSGLYWGLVGAVRELSTRMAEPLDMAPMILITGGAAPLLTHHFAHATHESNLTLQGILIAAMELGIRG